MSFADIAVHKSSLAGFDRKSLEFIFQHEQDRRFNKCLIIDMLESSVLESSTGLLPVELCILSNDAWSSEVQQCC